MPFIPYIRESARKHSREPLALIYDEDAHNNINSITGLLCIWK